MDQGSYAVESEARSTAYTELENQITVLKQQLKKLSEREIEARVRAESAEALIEKFFDKMLDKFH